MWNGWIVGRTWFLSLCVSMFIFRFYISLEVLRFYVLLLLFFLHFAQNSLNRNGESFLMCKKIHSWRKGMKKFNSWTHLCWKMTWIRKMHAYLHISNYVHLSLHSNFSDLTQGANHVNEMLDASNILHYHSCSLQITRIHFLHTFLSVAKRLYHFSIESEHFPFQWTQTLLLPFWLLLKASHHMSLIESFE